MTYMQFACRLIAMTKMIQVRDVPDRTHRVLRSRAAASGMSLSQYLLAELNRIAARPPISEVLDRAGSRGLEVRDADVVAAVRSGRDRRS
jgi:plasmid stability protein